MKIGFLQTPEFLSLPIFGLSLFENSIKVIKLSKNKKGFIPEYFETIEISETCDFFNNLSSTASCDEHKKILKELKKKYNMTFAQVSIPEDQTYVFKMMVAREVLSSITDFIANNLDQNIPLQSSEVYFDYKIIKSTTQDNLVPVVVTAIPRTFVERYADFLDLCGIYMVGCEPETHAIARSVIDKGDTNPYIIMNITEYTTSISIIEDGFVQYTQTLALTSSDIRGEITQETTQKIRDTLNRVIIYWFTSKDAETNPIKIENVILTGEGVDSPEFINFFETNLSVNVVHANVWKNCFDLKTYIPNISKKDSLSYAVCVGLALFKLK